MRTLIKYWPEILGGLIGTIFKFTMLGFFLYLGYRVAVYWLK